MADLATSHEDILFIRNLQAKRAFKLVNDSPESETLNLNEDSPK